MPRLVRLAAALAALSFLSTPSATAAPAPESGTTVRHLEVGGEHRTYRVFVPPTAERGGALVVALHGLYGSGRHFQRVSGWDEVAESAGVVVAYPDSYTAGWRSEPDSADVAFLAALIRRVVDKEHLDARRVYVVGHSSGAFMSYRFACERARLVAAIGPVAGAPATDCTNPPRRPVPVISVHGDADTVVPYQGGEPHVPGMPTEGVDLPSAHEVIHRWVRHDDCDTPAHTKRREGVVSETWRPCDAGAKVRLVTLEGWGHTYPTTAAGAPADATRTAWGFLRKFRLPAAA